MEMPYVALWIDTSYILYICAIQTVADFCTHNVVDEIAEIYGLLVTVKEIYFSGGRRGAH